LQRSVALDALEALVRILARYLALKRIQRAVRDLHAAVALERYIWRGIYYPRRVLSQLPFKRYAWRGVYYPRRVPSQLPLARSMHDELFSPRSASVRTLRLAGHLLSTQSTFAISVRTL
jgi:hypothetical protein